MPRPPADLQGPSAPKQYADSDRTVPRAPDGTYLLRVKSIRDRGWVDDYFSASGSQKPTLRITIVGTLQDDSEFVIARDVTHSYDARSILSLLGGVILGIDPKDKDVELKYIDLVDGQFLGKIESRTYHPKVDGKTDESVTNYFTEWRGEPMAVPGVEPKAPAPPPPAHPPQQPKAVSDDWTPAWDGQPLKSSISEEVWAEVKPVLRDLVDYFDGSMLDLHAYLAQDLGNGFNPHAEVVLSFFHERGPADITFNAAGKTDEHAEDLKLALHAFLGYWRSTESDSDSPDDQLPF